MFLHFFFVLNLLKKKICFLHLSIQTFSRIYLNKNNFMLCQHFKLIILVFRKNKNLRINTFWTFKMVSMNKKITKFTFLLIPYMYISWEHFYWLFTLDLRRSPDEKALLWCEIMEEKINAWKESFEDFWKSRVNSDLFIGQ